jgi:hypothetical protein
MNWPEEDLIRWIEWRVQERESSREQEKKGSPPIEPDHPLLETDMRIWLAWVRDELSHSEIAMKEYPKVWRKRAGKRGNQKAISRVMKRHRSR